MNIPNWTPPPLFNRLDSLLTTSTLAAPPHEFAAARVSTLLRGWHDGPAEPKKRGPKTKPDRPPTFSIRRCSKRNHHLRALPTFSHGILVRPFRRQEVPELPGECGGTDGQVSALRRLTLGTIAHAGPTTKKKAPREKNSRGASCACESASYRRLARAMIASWISRYTLVFST